jgi:parallel beta-helix repeat protein
MKSLMSRSYDFLASRSQPRSISFTTLVVPFLSAALLAACGGGGGAGGTSTPSASTVPGTSTSTATTDVADTGAGGTTDTVAPASTTVSIPVADNAPASVADNAPASVDDSGAAAQSTAVKTTTVLASNQSAANAIHTIKPPVVTAASSFTGTGYYVSAISGNDANPGTQTKPWATLARAAQARLKAGDALLLDCASKWRESVTFTSAFAPNGNVLISRYGSCAASQLPEITGGRLAATGWAVESTVADGTIFRASVTSAVNGMVRDQAFQTRARFPNSTTVGSDLSLSAAGTGSGTVVLNANDRTAVGGNPMNGAVMVVRTTPYTVESRMVTGYAASTGSASLSSPLANVPLAGAGYYVENLRWMLDADKEWFWDSAQGALFYFQGNDDTSTSPLEYTTSAVPITVQGIPNIRLEKISVTNSGSDAIRILDSANSSVSGVAVTNALGSGISVTAPIGLASGTVIKGSSVSGAGVSGISVGVTNATVSGNAVADMGTRSNPVQPVAGIKVGEAQSTVANNDIQRTGFSGISLANAAGVVANANHVSSACLRLSDCAGIYVWGKTTAGGARANITKNQVDTLTFANTNGAAGGAPLLVAGIYLDEGTNNADVTWNRVSNVRVGINVNKSSYNNVSNNTVFAASDAGLRVQSSGSDVLGNTLASNTLYVPNYFVTGTNGMPTGAGGTVQQWVHPTSAEGMLSGTNANVSSGNIAVHMGDQASLRWRMQTGAVPKDYDYSGWATMSATDSMAAPFYARMATVQGNQMVGNSTMDVVQTPWTSYSYVAGANIVGFAYQTPCQSSCAWLAPASTNDVLQQTGLLQTQSSSDLMYVRYRAVGGPLNTASKLEVRADVTPYAPLYLEPLTTLAAGATRHAEAFFTRNTTGNLRVTVKGQVGTTVMIDDVTLSQVSSFSLLSPLTPARLVVNNTAAPASYACADLGLSNCNVVDQNGAAMTWPISLPAQGSKVIFINDPAWVSL